MKKASSEEVVNDVMVELYGREYAKDVESRLEYLDPELNGIIQSIAYDQIWSRTGLSMRDKALITVSALIAMGKEEQTQIHMKGFLNSGGTELDLRNALIHLSAYCGFPSVMNGFGSLKKVIQNK